MARRRNCRELGVHVEPFWMSHDLPGCGESLPEQTSIVAAPMISGKANMLRVPDILAQPRSAEWLSRSGYFRASPPHPPPSPNPKTVVLLCDREEGLDIKTQDNCQDDIRGFMLAPPHAMLRKTGDLEAHHMLDEGHQPSRLS
jgi:hypothetical protein